MSEYLMGSPLPHGWSLCRLASIGEVISGGTPRTDTPEYWGGDIAWIGPSDMGKFKEKYIKTVSQYITKEGLAHSGAILMPQGSIIMSSRAPIGYLGITTFDICTNQGCKSIVPYQGIDPEWIYYALLQRMALIRSKGSGTTFKEISIRVFKSIVIPIPPLSEQNRIIKTINDSFKALIKIEVSQKRLVSLSNALKSRVLQSVFSSDKSYYEIASAGKLISGRDLNSAQYGDKGKTPYLTGASNFVHGAVQTNRYTDNPQVLSYEGDVLITCKGTIGKTAITPFRECHIARQIMAFRCNKTMINEYCKYLLLAKASDLQWASSSLIPGFDRNDFLGLKYPHKTIGEQQKVCLMLNKLFSTIDSICVNI